MAVDQKTLDFEDLNFATLPSDHGPNVVVDGLFDLLGKLIRRDVGLFLLAGGIGVQDRKAPLGGMPNLVADALENRYLIRAESRGAMKLYKLPHDRLVRPILESNKRYF